MTVDATYQPGVVQRRQNGSLCIVSGTTVSFESGGNLRVESGGAATFASGATVTIAGALLLPVEAGTTTAAFTAQTGLTTFGTTGTNAWTLAQPTAGAGIYKVLACTVHGATTVSQTVTCVGATILNATTAATSVMTFTSRASVALISASSLTWVLAHPAPTANVAFS